MEPAAIRHNRDRVQQTVLVTDIVDFTGHASTWVVALNQGCNWRREGGRAGCSRFLPFADNFDSAFFSKSGNTACMANENAETARRAMAQLHHGIEELRALLMAAAAAQLQANRACRADRSQSRGNSTGTRSRSL